MKLSPTHRLGRYTIGEMMARIRAGLCALCGEPKGPDQVAVRDGNPCIHIGNAEQERHQ